MTGRVKARTRIELVYTALQSTLWGCGLALQRAFCVVRLRSDTPKSPVSGYSSGYRTDVLRILLGVSTAEQPDDPTVTVYPPDEALRRARPLPPREELVVEGLTDAEWTAFQEALAEA